MDNRIERYTYPSFVGAILLAVVLVVVGAPGLAAVVFVLAGLIALVHAKMGQLDRGNALAAGIGSFVVAALAAVSDIFDYL